MALIFYAAAILTMVLPPWNLICWTGGLIYFTAKGSKNPVAEAFWLPYQIPVGLVCWILEG